MIPSGPNEHLFTVALGPLVMESYGSQPQVVLVNFTSVKPGAPIDPACIVEAGQHSFLTHDSYIAYRYAEIRPVFDVEKMVSDQVWRPAASCNNDLLQRIVDGFSASERVKRFIRDVVNTHL